MLKQSIHKLNPEAEILESEFSKINPREILNTKLFDFEKASQSAGWIKELENEHTPETEEYGIGSFVFRSKKPFHPERFWNYLANGFPASIIRSKGLFWLASRPDDAINWSQAGGSLRAERAGVWWVSMPFKERMQYAAFIENQKFVESRWDKRFGDRINELVFIGQDLEKDYIITELESCLCTESETVAMENKKKFKDPFPVW